MNALDKVIAIIVAVLLMFIIPVTYFQIKKDSIVQISVDNDTSRFVEMVSTQGYVTRGMYENYLKNLSETGKLYSVELEHELIAFEPEYKFRTPGEVVVEDESAWTGVNEYYGAPVSTTVPIVVDPVDNSGTLNTETNASVLASAVNTPASASHIHTDACYNGTKHIHTGNSSSGGGCYGGGGSGQSCSLPKAYMSTSGSNSTFRCHECGGTAYISHVWDTYRCGAMHSSTVSIYWYRICGSCGDEYQSGSGVSGNWTGTSCGATSTTYTMNCGKTEGYYYSGSTQVYPICNQNVVSVLPTHTSQTVATNDALITTMKVFYQDGSSKVVEGTTPFSTANVGQNQTAVITYAYVISGVPYTITGTITVTVVPRSKTCSYGHVYNLNSDGSDPGCIYCHSWLLSLSVYAPSGGQLTMYRNPGGSLETEGVGLMAIYLDGHTEYVYNGYLDNLDPDYVGTQTVTIGYKGLLTSLQVGILRNRIQCGTCGLHYDLYLDSTDPGCPFCKAREPVFTGNVMEYCTATYDDEILTELYEGSGTYYFRRGDTFSVKAESKSKVEVLSLIGRLTSLQVRLNKKDTIKDEFIHQ